jgi:cell shape-determining protein MreC
MTTSKINLLLLPLLLSILLSVSTKLRIGKAIDSVFYTVLAPIHLPIGSLRQTADNQITFIKSLPTLQKENRNLLSENALLLSQNEQLKQSQTDSANPNLKSSFKSVLPVRVTGSVGNNTVTSSLPLDNVQIGQPLVSGTILLGTVSSIKGSVINIKPLDEDGADIFSVHTSSGQKGFYKFTTNTSLITDIPSLSPIITGDYVFTEPTPLIPGNLVIGKILKVTSGAEEPLQKAEIRLETALSNNPDNLTLILQP